MELKLPPPLIFLLCAAMIYFSPTLFNSFWLTQGLAALFVLVGIWLDLSSLNGFWQKRTTINPFSPQNTTALVTSGVYRFTRNPMYLSLTFYLIAEALWFGKPFIVAIFVFVFYITRFQIVPEEKMLAEKFGQAYRDYQAKVRRWL